MQEQLAEMEAEKKAVRVTGCWEWADYADVWLRYRERATKMTLSFDTSALPCPVV